MDLDYSSAKESRSSSVNEDDWKKVEKSISSSPSKFSGFVSCKSFGASSSFTTKYSSINGNVSPSLSPVIYACTSSSDRVFIFPLKSNDLISPSLSLLAFKLLSALLIISASPISFKEGSFVSAVTPIDVSDGFFIEFSYHSNSSSKRSSTNSVISSELSNSAIK